MKKSTFLCISLLAAILLSCSKDQLMYPESPESTGALQASINIEKIGALQKAMKTECHISMRKLVIVLSAEGQISINDTFTLTGGTNERTQQITYTDLASWVDGQVVEWTLSAKVLDQYNHVVQSGDTVFTLSPDDTTAISMFLTAMYSMLEANYFPIRDSVNRCVLNVDGNAAEADSSFLKQSLFGDTVKLGYAYLTASPSGISHRIDLNVYGVLLGIEVLLYAGDTTILVKSGLDEHYEVVLEYVGPDQLNGTAKMVVQIGKVGKVTMNGYLQSKEPL